MTKWSFLTNHARALICIAHDPGVRLRDIATMLGITERSAALSTTWPQPATCSRTRKAVATVTRSKPICHCENPWAENRRSVRCWRSWSTQTSPSEREEATGDEMRAEARWLVAGLQGPSGL
jgi:hypothetical protein